MNFINKTTHGSACVGKLHRHTKRLGAFTYAEYHCDGCGYWSQILLSIDGITGRETDGELTETQEQLLGSLYQGWKE